MSLNFAFFVKLYRLFRFLSTWYETLAMHSFACWSVLICHDLFGRVIELRTRTKTTEADL